MADQQNNNDVQIPPPQPAASPPPAQTGPAPASTTQSTSTPAAPDLIFRYPEHGLSTNQLLIGGVASLVLLAVFWFVGRVLTDTLVKQYAEVGAAKRAGLTLFVFLAVLGLAAMFGFMGNYWSTPFFLTPSIGLILLLLFLFIFTLVGASRTRRR